MQRVSNSGMLNPSWHVSKAASTLKAKRQSEERDLQDSKIQKTRTPAERQYLLDVTGKPHLGNLNNMAPKQNVCNDHPCWHASIGTKGAAARSRKGDNTVNIVLTYDILKNHLKFKKQLGFFIFSIFMF